MRRFSARGRPRRYMQTLVLFSVFAGAMHTLNYLRVCSNNMPLLNNSSDFYVVDFNVVNDTIEVVGYLRETTKNTNSTMKTVLRLLGVQSVIDKVSNIERHLQDESIIQFGRSVNSLNCEELVIGQEEEISNALKNDTSRIYTDITADEYIKMTANCSSFKLTRNYITDSLTNVEEEFPIAFSMLVYKDIEQFERLLRAIYRPQNFYCVHVDLNNDTDFFNAVTAITECFPNVYMPTQRVKVKWGKISVLEPDLICMNLLYKKSELWKYFINLTGQEFPLRTNYELVNILKAYKGANDIWGTRENTDSQIGRGQTHTRSLLRKKIWHKRWEDHGKAPHEIVPAKGWVHIVACRGFVEYVINDQKAKDLYKWVENTRIPDETFFSSLNHNPHLNIPGSYNGEINDGSKSFLARFKMWKNVSNYTCRGRYVRRICILGIGDLPALARSKQLFANKFFWNYQRPAYECLEQLHYNRTRDEYLGKHHFDASWYGSHDFVLNKI